MVPLQYRSSHRRFVTAIALMVLAVAAWLPASAHAQTTADLEAFRDRLATFLREIEEVHVLTGVHAEGARGPGEAAPPDLAALTYDELAKLMRAYPDDPRFWDAPKKLLVVLKRTKVTGVGLPGMAASLAQSQQMRAVLAGWPGPSARRSRLSETDLSTLVRTYASGQPTRQAPQAVLATLQRTYRVDADLPGRGEFLDRDTLAPPMRAAAPTVGRTDAPAAESPCPAGFDYEALWVARDAEMVADIAMELIPEDAFTSPAYIIAAVAWSALKVTLFVVEQIYERWDDCESALVFENVDASISSRASQTSVDALQTGVSSLQSTIAVMPATISAESTAVLQAGVATIQNTIQATVGAESAATRSSVDALAGRIDSLTTSAASGTAVSATNALVTDTRAEVRDLSALVNATVPRRMGPSGPITAYTLTNFEGGAQQFHGTETGTTLECMSAPFRYGIRSLRVPAGTTVTFYSQCGFQGVSATFTATDEDLTDNKLQVNSTVSVFPAASMRIEQTTVALPDVVASQTGLDLLAAKVDALDLSSNSELADKIETVATTIGAAPLSHLDATVSSRASQAAVDQIGAAIAGVGAAVDAPISTRASEAAVTEVRTGIGSLQTALGSRATQASVDALAAGLATVEQSVAALDLSRLDAGVSTRASQAAVDSLQSAVTGLQQDLVVRTTGLQAALSTRASQAGLDAAVASVLASVQQRFDDLQARVAQQPLQLQVIDLSKDRLLLYVTEAGRPVSGALLTRLQALGDAPRSAGLAVTDVTASATTTEVAPGVLEIRLRKHGADDGLIISVTHGSGSSARAASMVFRPGKGRDN